MIKTVHFSGSPVTRKLTLPTAPSNRLVAAICSRSLTRSSTSKAHQSLPVRIELASSAPMSCGFVSLRRSADSDENGHSFRCESVHRCGKKGQAVRAHVSGSCYYDLGLASLRESESSKRRDLGIMKRMNRHRRLEISKCENSKRAPHGANTCPARNNGD